MAKKKDTRNSVVKYLVDEFYNGSPGEASKATGFSKQQIQHWISHKNQPQKANVACLMEWAVRTTRNDIVRYLVDEHYANSPGEAAKASGFTKRQIEDWIDGFSKPQKANVSRLMHQTFVPEFKVIIEYKPIELSGNARSISSQLTVMLKGYTRSSGIYAFYDSMSNLVYLGKSDGNLLGECYQQLRAPVKGAVFPKGAIQPKRRTDVVRYISAYHVRSSDHQDHAKHVESLILRISKPHLNKNIGTLKYAD